MNQATEVKTIQMVTRHKVLQLLGWDDLQLGEFLMQQGEAYLHRFMGDDQRGIDQLKNSQGFWAWFKNHWHRRDMVFVIGAGKLSQADRRSLYTLTHESEAINFRPHSSIMRVVSTTYQPDDTDQLEQLYDEMECHLRKAEELASYINQLIERSKHENR